MNIGGLHKRHEVIVQVLQRIRAGWLPHTVGPPENGSWWWGRPTDADGFRLWSQGMTPSMEVVERMTLAEARVWIDSLHPLAPEAESDAQRDAMNARLKADYDQRTGGDLPSPGPGGVRW